MQQHFHRDLALDTHGAQAKTAPKVMANGLVCGT